MTLSVGEAVRAIGGELVAGDPHAPLGRISIDTRSLKPGETFLALEGPRHDGHTFVLAAVRKKAKSLIMRRIDQAYSDGRRERPDLLRVNDTLKALHDLARHTRTKAEKTQVVGLTGSNGKTTTKEMLAGILRLHGKTLATRGNLNNHIGLPLMLTELTREHRFAVLEMGTSKKGDMDLLIDLTRPKVGLITNVGKDHLEFFGSPEGALEVNRKLFDVLPRDGTAVINLDDPLLKGFIGKLSCRTLSFGVSPAAQVRAESVRLKEDGVHFKLQVGRESVQVDLPALGEIQMLNALAAAATAYALAVPLPLIAKGLSMFSPAPMRMETKTRADGAIIINDAYNANPSSVRASVESVCRFYPNKPHWVVLGDMRELGKASAQEHRDLGRWMRSQKIDRIFLYGRDTRYVEEGLRAETGGSPVARFKKKRYLIEVLRTSLKVDRKPVILIKASRKMQLEQVSHALLSLPS